MLPKIHFINQQTDYLGLLDHIKNADIYFLDTEFIRETTYRPIIALIQIAIDDENAYLIDPTFDGFDASPLFDLLRNPNKKIVLHSARQDLEIFYHHFNFTAHNLADTQIIAAALGYGDQIGFEGLVKAITGISLDKSQQRTDWLKRPLTENQLTYAAYDVLYLAKIYPFLEGALVSQGRLDWISDEIQSLCNPDIFMLTPEAIFKKIKHNLHQKKAIYALQELSLLRENIAIEKDLIRTYICPDNILVTLAEKRPKTSDHLLTIKNLRHNFIKTYQTEIIEAILKADSKVDVVIDTPKPERLTHSQEKLVNILSLTADATASNHSVARRLFATHADIIEFVKNTKAPFLAGWRYDLFGKIVIDIMKGTKGLFYKQGQITIEP